MKSPFLKSIATLALVALTALGVSAQTTYNYVGTADNNAASEWDVTTNWDNTMVPGSFVNFDGAFDDVVNLVNNFGTAQQRIRLLDSVGEVGTLNIGGEGASGNTGNTQLMVRGGGALEVNGLLTLGAVGPFSAGERGGLIQQVGGASTVILANVVSGSTNGANNLQVNDNNAVLEISGDIDTAAIRTDSLDANEIDLKILRGTLDLVGAGAQTLNVESFDVTNVNVNNANTTVEIGPDKTVNAVFMEVGRNSSNDTQNNRTVTGTLNIFGGTVTTVNDVKLANLGGTANSGNVANGNVNVGDATNPGTFLIGGELRLSALNQDNQVGVSTFTVDHAASVVTIGRGIEFASQGNRDAAAATMTINAGTVTVTSEIERSDLGDTTLNVLGGELVLLNAQNGPRAVENLFHTGGTIDYLAYADMPSFDTSAATLAGTPGGSLIDLTAPAADSIASLDDTTSAIAGGDWFNAAIWDSGQIPANSANLISTSDSITLLTSDTAIVNQGNAALTPAADVDWDLDQTSANAILATRTGAPFGSGPTMAVINGALTVTSASSLNIQNTAGAGADATRLEVGPGNLTLTGSSDLTLGGTAQGTVTQGGGIVTVGGNLLFGGPGGTQGGTYTLTTGSLNVTGDIIEDTPGVNTANLYLDDGTNPLTVSGGDISIQSFRVANANGAVASQTIGGATNYTATANTIAGYGDLDGTTGTDGTITIDTTGVAIVGELNAGYRGRAEGTITITGNADVTASSLNIGRNQRATGTLNIDGILTSTGRAYVAGIAINNSDSATTGTITIGSTGSLTVNAGNTEIGRGGNGTLVIDGTFLQKANNLVLGQTGGSNLAEGTALINAGSTVTIGDADNGPLNTDININNSGGTITQTGGDLEVERNLNLAGGDEDSSYSISAGTLFVGGNIDVRGGNGNDTVTITGTADVSIDGNIAMAGGSNNVLEITGSDHSIFVLGNLVGGPTATLRIGFDSFGVSEPQVGDATLNDTVLELTGILPTTGSQILIDVAGTVNGTFLGIPEGGFFEQGGQNYQMTYLGGDGNDVAITAVAGPIVIIEPDSASVTEGGTAGFTLTRIGPPAGDIDVTLAYSGSAADGSDFTGTLAVTIPDTVTSFDLDLPTSLDEDYEGCEVIIATITGVTSAVNAEVGTPFAASISLLDANVAPAGNEELAQTIAGSGTVPINDIVVTDPDAAYDSNYDTTTALPFFEYSGQGDVSVFRDGTPNDDGVFTTTGVVGALGFALDAEFIPAPGDLDGTVMLWEIGGSSNGTSLYLLDGIPHLLIKANGNPEDAPTDDGSVAGVFTDLDFNTPNTSADLQDDTVVVPLTTTALTANMPARLALHLNTVSNLVSSVTYSVNGAAPATANFTGNNANSNWIGNQSVSIAQAAGGGTGGSNDGTLAYQFSGASLKNPVNGPAMMGCVRFWNEASGSIGTASGSAQQVTATLTVTPWASPSDGFLTGLSGGTGGVYTTTGDAAAVNATLAAMEFVESTATYPVVITVLIEDDLGASTTGFIVINDTPPATVYVDDSFSGAPGDAIADADGGSATSSATFQADAFTNFADALAVVAAGGTIVVNDGTYAELVSLTGTTTLRVTDSAGPVTIDSLASEAGNTIQIDSPNTLVVGDDAGNNIIAGTISGAGGLTKAGTDVQILAGENTHTGLITVSAGTLRVGDNATTTTALAGNGSIVVALDALLQVRPAVDRTITVARTISGDGAVASQGDGTTELSGAGPNTFSGGFDLGDGAVSSFDGVDQGAKQGFVVVNNSGHLGSGLITSRGAQLQAGSAGINIPNDIDISGGGFRMGGTVPYELSGVLAPIGGTRGVGNYGLEGMVVTISNEIDLYDEAAAVPTGRGASFEASGARDNGDIIVSGDITGTDGTIQMAGSYDDGVIALLGTNTYTGTTIVAGGVVDGALFLNGTHTGGGIYNVNGGILTGAGTTDSTVNVNGNGTIGGGSSATSSGILTTGDLTILGTLLVGLEDTTQPAGPGGYSQVAVNGTVDVTTATLAFLEASGANVAVATLTIVANDSAEAVNGIFTGLPEGASAPIGAGTQGAISYVGDTGNDITLAVTVGVADSDSDGIPDDYEIANGLNPNDPTDADSDPDGDNTNALEEYLFGTLENNGASVFTINVTAVNVGAGTVDVTYGPVFNGLSYELSASPDVATWTLIDTFNAAADAADNVVIDAGVLVGEAFRVEVFGNELP